MTKNEAQIGVRVRSLVDFTDVPAGSEGVIDEDYGRGVMVAWDKPNERAAALPVGRREYDGKFKPYIEWERAGASKILRYGFDKERELEFLEVVG